ncbi:MAG: carboxypeptidase-like regulatory domain-containing protein [Prevotella sp.]|nr:carboxypeptidase-like regulatory domain-containing protein [Prevotella sp.]
MRRLITITLLMLTTIVVAAQGYHVVAGMVSDAQSRQPLARVSITADGVATVTNEQGRFTLKVPGARPAFINVSMLGFKARHVAVPSDDSPLDIMLTPSIITLNEIVVRADDAVAVVRAALSKVPDNYSRSSVLYKGFYRETVQKRRQFISVSEAVVDVYKTSYEQDISREAVAITRGRRLLNMKPADTLGVKIMGGPVLPVVADVVKNSEMLFYEDDMPYYHFEMDTPQKLDDRLQYVVHMSPRQQQRYALFYATLYIDQQTLAFTRAELTLDMSRRLPAMEAMLVKKPATLHFRPRELSFSIHYRTEDGVTYLSYVRNVMRFTCDWRRRLFYSPFTTISEFVVTDRQQQAVRPIRGRDTFSRRDKLYDRVEYFSDPNFWGPDNIIEPTETLDKAIERLKRRVSAAASPASDESHHK